MLSCTSFGTLSPGMGTGLKVSADCYELCQANIGNPGWGACFCSVGRATVAGAPPSLSPFAGVEQMSESYLRACDAYQKRGSARAVSISACSSSLKVLFAVETLGSSSQGAKICISLRYKRRRPLGLSSVFPFSSSHHHQPVVVSSFSPPCPAQGSQRRSLNYSI